MKVTGLEAGGYFEVMLQQVFFAFLKSTLFVFPHRNKITAIFCQIPTIYWGTLAISIGAVLAAFWWSWPSQNFPQINDASHEKEEEEEEQTSNCFEISPDDECEFVPNNPEEDASRVPASSKYIPLDPARPGQQVKLCNG